MAVGNSIRLKPRLIKANLAGKTPKLTKLIYIKSINNKITRLVATAAVPWLLNLGRMAKKTHMKKIISEKNTSKFTT